MKNTIIKSIFIFLFIGFSPKVIIAQVGWKWGVGSNGTIEQFGGIAVDVSGHAYVSMINSGPDTAIFGPFSVSDTNYGDQLIIVKTDSSGNYKWVVNSKKNTGIVNPKNIALDVNNNIYVFGAFAFGASFSIDSFTLINPDSGSASRSICFLIKISSAGDILWAKTIATSCDNNVGGMGIDNTGNIYLTEDFWNDSITIGATTLLNKSYTSTFIAKYDSSGNATWAKVISNRIEVYPENISVANDGDFYLNILSYPDTIIIGSDTVTGSPDFLAKFNSSGNLDWAKNWNPGFRINKTIIDGEENFYITGGFSYALPVLGSDTLVFIGAHDVTDFYVAKFDSSGNVLWASSGGSGNGDQGFGITLDVCGNLWVSGGISMSGSDFTFFLPGLTSHILPIEPGSNDPMFIAEYDNSGHYITSMAMSSGGDDQNSIIAGKNGIFYLTGDYWNTNIIFGADTLFQNGFYEALFIAKYQFNHIPHFIGGPEQTLTLCENAVATPINSYLAIIDSDMAQSETWGIVTMPSHGIVAASYGTTSTGGLLTPVGISYTPATGYIGIDSFKIKVNDCINESDIITIHVAIDHLPVAGIITGLSYVCIDAVISLSDTATGGIWSTVNLNATISGNIVTGIIAGVDTIAYTVTNSCGTIAAIKLVTINTLPSAGIITGPEAFCVGDTISLNDAIEGGVWSSSNSSAAISGNLVAGILSGADTIAYTVTNSCGTIAAIKLVTVNTLPSAEIITGPITLCVGDTISLNDVTEGGVWKSSNSLAAISANLIVAGVLAGADTITYSVTNSCGTAIAMQYITISPLPDTLAISHSGSVLSVPPGYAFYQWTLNGTPIPGATANTYSYSNTGTFSVTVTNTSSCSFTYMAIVISDCGIDDIQVYPNPAMSMVFIQWCKDVTVRLSCVDGKLIKIDKNVKQIDIGYLPNGTYMLSLFDSNDNLILTKRITKL